MADHYIQRKDSTKFPPKSFNGADELIADISNSDVLTYNAHGVIKILATTDQLSGGAAGPTSSIQFNNAGVFGGSSNLVWTGSELGIGNNFPALDATTTQLISAASIYTVPNNSSYIGVRAQTELNGTSGVWSSTSSVGVQGESVSAGTSNYAGLTGVLGIAFPVGTGTIGVVKGVSGQVITFAAGPLTNVVGLEGIVNNSSGNAPIINGIGINSTVTGSNFTNIIGLELGAPSNGAASALARGVDIGDWHSVGAVGNSYNIYSEGALSVNRFDGSINLGPNKTFSAVAPTIASGFGSTPSILTGGIATTFRVNVGTGGVATNGVITMPTAANGWNAYVNNLTAAAGHRADNTRQTASTVSSITIENQTTTTGAAIAWGASDIITVIAVAF